MKTSLIEIIKSHVKLRKSFVEFMTPNGVRSLIEAPLLSQVGWVVKFLEKENIGVTAYHDGYDIYIINVNLVNPTHLSGLIKLEMLVVLDGITYIHYGRPDKELIMGLTNNLLTGLQEAITYAEQYDLKFRTNI